MPVSQMIRRLVHFAGATCGTNKQTMHRNSQHLAVLMMEAKIQLKTDQQIHNDRIKSRNHLLLSEIITYFSKLTKKWQ